MTVSSMSTRVAAKKSEHFAVLIVGAGISGIGAAYHLGTQCPDKSYVALEALESFGGTWFMHRYPGVRSDSDLYTFGYRFKPWIGPPIATADEIRKYMGEVIEDNHLDQHIRYRHKILSASWSSEDGLWTVEAVRTDTNEALHFTTHFLWMCQGYYRHARGYTPEWAGMDEFQGRIVHPQNWPEDLDYQNKRLIVIGSGATTATVVPAIAGDCAHVTVLQRSPTYFIPGFNQNNLADTLRSLDIAFTVDGKAVDVADAVTYRGMMFTGLPNLLWIFGYFRASWTLRVDLLADFVCRLLKHMQAKGAAKVTVALRPEDADMPIKPWIDPEDFNPGYLMRSLDLLPKRGDKAEWQHTQDYWAEKDTIPAIDLDGAEFVYEVASSAARTGRKARA